MNLNIFNNLNEQILRLGFNKTPQNSQSFIKNIFNFSSTSDNPNPDPQDNNKKNLNLNVLGERIKPCSSDPLTGFMRDGYCKMTPFDFGYHIVCVKTTEEFLQYSKEQGNDLSTPRQIFPGLKPGDKWCVCAARFREALKDGKAPKVDLEATDQLMLKFVEKKDLVKLSEFNIQQTITILNNY